MAWENRDYAKRDRPPGEGWTRGVKWLIVLNALCYLAELVATHVGPTPVSPERIYELVGLVPRETLEHHRAWTIFTYSFVHDLGNPFHVILNGYLLWVAGRDLEFIHGTHRLVRFYVGAALFTGVIYLCASLVRPEASNAPLLGATGPAMAVLVAYALLHPGDRILVFLVVEVPIWVGVLIMVGLDLAMVSRGPSGGIAAGCAVSGVAFAFGTHWLRDRIEAWEAARPSPRARPVPPATVDELLAPPAPAGVPRPADGTPEMGATRALELELDAVLRKLHEQGMGALSPAEKATLERASRLYRHDKARDQARR